MSLREAARKPSREPDSYLEATRRPLDSLVFLLPLIAIYELGTLYWLPRWSAGPDVNVGAHVLLQMFFRLFGPSSYHLPALLVVAILLSWHIASGARWRVRWSAVAGIAGESLCLALPLLLLQDSLHAGLTGSTDQRWFPSAVLSIGAGVYEELVFRLGVITIASMVLIDLMRLPRNGSMVAIVLLAAGLFASYHHVYPATEPFRMVPFLFRAAAGIYLGGVFVLRGFGVTAGVHTCYNLLIISVAAAESASQTVAVAGEPLANAG